MSQYDRDNLVDAEPPTFTLDARDRHAVGTLIDYRQRVHGDGVASAEYVSSVDAHLARFKAWQEMNPNQVMSADQPYRSAHDIDPAQADVVARRADPLVPEDGEPDALNPGVGTHLHGEEGTIAPPGPETGQDRPVTLSDATEGQDSPSSPSGPQTAQEAYMASLSKNQDRTDVGDYAGPAPDAGQNVTAQGVADDTKAPEQSTTGTGDLHTGG